jgi:gluconate 2-dehydrogenase gamma chain
MSDTPDVKKGVSRRVALKVLGSLPVAITAGPGLADAAPPTAPPPPANTLSPAPGMPAPPPVAAAKGAYVPKFFSEGEWKTASALADMIIPRDERSGSATDARVVEYIDEYAAYWGGWVQPRVRGGLMWLDRECSLRFDKPFVDCTVDQRRQVLELIAYPPKDEPTRRPDVGQREPPAQAGAAAVGHPEKEPLPSPEAGPPTRVPLTEPEREATASSAGIAFFTLFRDLTATGFFTSEIGIKDLGFMGNQPYDWKGCPPEVVASIGLKKT